MRRQQSAVPRLDLSKGLACLPGHGHDTGRASARTVATGAQSARRVRTLGFKPVVYPLLPRLAVLSLALCGSTKRWWPAWE
jgi:hypothetical protein